METHPVKLEMKDDRHLLIEWRDGQRREYAVAELREACPCASCREKRSQPAPAPSALTVLSAEETRPLRLLEMKPVGSYAYGIHFSDGHDTGIYTFDVLRHLGREV